MSHSATISTDTRTRTQRFISRVIAPLLYGYLRLVAKTCRFDLDSLAILNETEMLGYWHGDSTLLMLLITRYRHELVPVDVIITADWRGDIISYIVQKNGVNPIRTKDGVGIRDNLREIVEISGRRGRIFALSLDGPTGPRHEVKKLVPFLARQAKCEVRRIDFDVRYVVRLIRRWDHYVLPLPFSRIHGRILDEM